MSGKGPGYATPLEAMKGPREKLLWAICIKNRDSEQSTQHDYLATVDVDPQSITYCQVIHRLYMPYANDELHHSGWNACSSCHSDPTRKRNRLILPALGSSRIYAVDIENEREPKIHKSIEPSIMKDENKSYPHTTHCLPNGQIMISTMGDQFGEKRGSFINFDSQTFQLTKPWTDVDCEFGYDFWYQPYFDILISSEWGTPNSFKCGFIPQHIKEGKCGSKLNVFSWKTRKLTQVIELGETDGLTPLEIRFLHDPLKSVGFVGCALGGAVFRFYLKDDGKWDAHRVIKVPALKVTGWVQDSMPATITDILISLDDRFLYFSNWMHGDVRQYDITDTENPKLVGQIFLGGLLQDPKIKLIESSEKEKMQNQPASIKGKSFHGSPQMLQLSLDGKRLYVTDSLYTPWDEQFYPDLVKNGSKLLQIDVNTETGGLTLNQNFLVDFGEEPNGPCRTHEMRYPGGDCTSDIWLAKDSKECQKCDS